MKDMWQMDTLSGKAVFVKLFYLPFEKGLL